MIDAAAITRTLPFDRLIAGLRERFAQGCEVPQRQILSIPVPGALPLTTMLMPAWIEGQFYGVKVINMTPDNAARGLPGLHASYLLYDAVTGVPLCMMDGDALTLRRTAAASALAASFLARQDVRHLLVVGAGRVAALLPEAYHAVRNIEEVSVWARRPEQAEHLARQWQALGMRARAVTDLAAAAAAADLVSCATLSGAPVVQGAWLRAGTHLDLIGSFTPQMREADDACFANADVYVDTPEALKKSGDLIGPLARGILAAEDVRADLAALCRGDHPGRQNPHARTVFKSVGTALEDLAAAMLVWAEWQPKKPVP